MPPPWYIESEHFRNALGDDAVQVLDGGSRGGDFAPFDELDAPVTVTGFEPDPDLEQPHTVPRALWRSSGEIEVHLAEGRAVSSVYPPNAKFLRLFPGRAGVEGRRTERIAKLPAISIDDAVREGICPTPDFIKLDIHSAEYEALEGARGALEDVAGVLVETWHAPVHAGQRLHGDVERLLNESGLHLFDRCPAAAWRTTLDGETSSEDHPRLIASDALFFREFLGEARPASRRAALVAVALFDLYGYTNHAARLSREWAGAGVLDHELQREVEDELLRLRGRRGEARGSETSGGRFPRREGRPPLRQRLGAALSALRGAGSRPSRPPAPSPHPLETGTQRLTKNPWS